MLRLRNRIRWYALGAMSSTVDATAERSARKNRSCSSSVVCGQPRENDFLNRAIVEILMLPQRKGDVLADRHAVEQG